MRFGNNSLDLVFRALNVNPSVVTDIPEPSTKGTITDKSIFDYKLYPNPVNEYTTIEYSLNDQSNVSIEIFDLLGKKIANVFEGKQNAGTYKVLYEPNSMTNGIYLCKVSINNNSVVKKMTIVK